MGRIHARAGGSERRVDLAVKKKKREVDEGRR